MRPSRRPTVSEAIPGLTAPPHEPPRDAAVVLLWRSGPSGREVFWLRRGARLAFWGGMYAFPGGKLDRADAAVPVEGASGQDAALRACAARELFEEAGVLLAEGVHRLAPAELAELRQKLLAGALGFRELLASRGLRLRAEALAPAGRWITPPFLPKGFDARLFLAELPEGQTARVFEGEASEGGFVSPADALARWREGRALLHPPNLNALRALSAPTWDETLHLLREPELVANHVAQWLEFQEGVVLVALRTPTLLPATHTNCYLLGLDDVVLVDPGADDPAELAVLFERVRTLKARGRRPVAILATHHHRDHVGGLAAVARELDLPVWAHRHTADRLEVPCARLIDDGEELGLRGFPLEALHTPGHTRGHLALYHRPSRAVIAGDLVSSLSTIVIDPPEGNMAQYLASLRRLLDLPCGTIYPAHGSPIADGPGKLREYLAHRGAREAQVLAALRAGAGSPAEVVAQAYQDTPEPLHPIAERQALAHLEKLAAEGRAQRQGERWLAADRV
jgi:glyoxylase-like metal-dependent hydrolase (beta-lactamase superfamily II)